MSNATSKRIHGYGEPLAPRRLEVCVAATCVNAPVGDTKHGWCPFCGDCLREMLIPIEDERA